MSKVVSQILFLPLNDPDFVSTLSSLSLLLRSSFGPYGKLKIVVTGGGYFIVTSSCKRLISNIIIENPICLFISQVMKSQLTDFKDFGLFTGVLLSELLSKALVQESLSHNVASSFLQQINSDLVSILNSIKFKVDFSTVKQLLPLVKTILNSKPACSLSSIEVDHITIAIVKAFLNSVCEDVGDVNVICVECCGLDKPSIISGCLYQTSDDAISFSRPVDIFTRNGRQELVMVFNIMLSHEKSTKQEQVGRVQLNVDKESSFSVEKALQLLENAVRMGVSIVACQKVVHPWLKLYLRRKGILLLDRMGTEITCHVVNISGAVPISDLAICGDGTSLEPLLGYVASVRRVSWGGKFYISLERPDRNVSTLLVRAANPEAAEELKITIGQALHSLRSLLMDPFLIPGSGCSEMVMAAKLHDWVLQTDDKERYPLPTSRLQACVRWLQISLLTSAGLLKDHLNLAVDSAYFHAWDFNTDTEQSRCHCGLVTAALVKEKSKQWTTLNMSSEVLFSHCNQPCDVTSEEMADSVHVDLYGSKCNALKLALEGCIGLLGVGMIVSKPSA